MNPSTIQPSEPHTKSVSWLEEFILGGQDGLVNVLGVLLGVAVATNDSRIVIIAGFAAVAAESLSMGAVGYTSRKAARDYYECELQREIREIEELPDVETLEVRDIYSGYGYTGKNLDDIVRLTTSNKKAWLNLMMAEELHLSGGEDSNPVKEALVILTATLIGSIIPLIPFFIFPVKAAIGAALIISIIILFAAGAVKAKLTIGSWYRSGFEMAVIGTIAALAGYAIGLFMGAPLGLV